MGEPFLDTFGGHRYFGGGRGVVYQFGAGAHAPKYPRQASPDQEAGLDRPSLGVTCGILKAAWSAVDFGKLFHAFGVCRWGSAGSCLGDVATNKASHSPHSILPAGRASLSQELCATGFSLSSPDHAPERPDIFTGALNV